MMRYSLLALAAIAASACIPASGELQIALPQSEEELYSAVELLVVAGKTRDGTPASCDDIQDESTHAINREKLDVLYEGLIFRDPAAGATRAEPIGLLDPGPVLFFGRGRDSDCRIIGEGCQKVTLRSGDAQVYSIRLTATSYPELPGCEAGLACVAGECRPCREHADCEDGDDCTADMCEQGEAGTRCAHVQGLRDADGDGFSDVLCGGEDCDDEDAGIYPGGTARCGDAGDHDCDGIVDDTQGCGSCSGATGLRFLYSIRAPAVGLFVIGAPPEDPDADHELFVATPGQIRVYRAPASPPPGEIEPTGETPYELGEPLAPQVVGDYTMVANFGSQGQLIYATADLRAGGARALCDGRACEPEEEPTPVGKALGLVSAFVSGTRYSYLSVGATGGTLALEGVSDLPRVEQPFGVTVNGWRPCDSLAMAPAIVERHAECVAADDSPTCGAAGGTWNAECAGCDNPLACAAATDDTECEEAGGTWNATCACATTRVFGVLGQFVSYAEIDEMRPPPTTEQLEAERPELPMGPVLSLANRGIDDGFGTDIAVGGGWVALAQGDEGVLLLDEETLVDPEQELVRHSLPLPVGCVAAECENANGIALVGTNRAVVMTFTNLGAQKTEVYLVDISAPEVWDYAESSTPPAGVYDDIIAQVDISDSLATGRDMVVAGSRLYVAAKQQEGTLGVIDVFEIVCP